MPVSKCFPHKASSESGEIELAFGQVVTGAGDFDEFRSSWNQLDRGADFIDRSERVLRSVDEQRRYFEGGEVSGARLCGLARRMKRVGKE